MLIWGRQHRQDFEPMARRQLAPEFPNEDEFLCDHPKIIFGI